MASEVRKKLKKKEVSSGTKTKKSTKKGTKKASSKKKSNETEEIRDTVKNGSETKLYTPINTDVVLSTGSTLLDLCISGGRIRGGGLPGGLMVEIYGPSGAGKTAIVTELLASAQHKGGDTKIDDPEGRFDQEYARIFGCSIDKGNYKVSDQVKEVFDHLLAWNPKAEKQISIFAVDSIAALCSETEAEEWDKRGQAKAKELTQGCRKLSTKLTGTNKVVVFTNHEKDGEYGKTTPGGKAVPYHSSLRIRSYNKKPIEKTKEFKTTVRGSEKKRKVTSTIGIQSTCFIKKSSIDKEFRECPLFIIFGVGIDDVRANLQYVKDMTKDSVYDAFDKTYQSMDAAVKYIENNNLEADLRERVIDIWEEVEAMFETERKEKVRF